MDKNTLNRLRVTADAYKVAQNAKELAEAPIKAGTITDTRRVNTAPGLATLLANQLLGTTNSIEQMEQRGAEEVAAQRERLPTEQLDREQAEKIGIQVHEVDAEDPIWTRITLPEGWRIQTTDHVMWTKLLDDKGRKRASIFYKAAFYDRHAHISFEERYVVAGYDVDCYDPPDPCEKQRRRAIVRDTATNKIVFSTEWLDPEEPRNRKAEEALQEQARRWLDDNYPDHEDPAAYWD